MCLCGVSFCIGCIVLRKCNVVFVVGVGCLDGCCGDFDESVFVLGIL